jgi:hypothetical protein
MRWPLPCQPAARPVSSDRPDSLCEPILESDDATPRRFREADHSNCALMATVLPQADLKRFALVASSC